MSQIDDLGHRMIVKICIQSVEMTVKYQVREAYYYYIFGCCCDIKEIAVP